MKKFMVYLDDGYSCYKVAVPAKDEKSALNFVAGNGEVIAIKDVTSDYPISLDKVVAALKAALFGKAEIDFISRCLVYFDIAE